MSKRYTLSKPLKMDDENMVKEILKPFTYLTTNIDNSTKRNLLKVLGSWLKVPEFRLAQIDEIVHYVYNGSLLLDDMHDNSALRRGQPTAHRVYGYGKTITAINWTQADTWDLLQRIDNIEVSKAIIRTIPKLLAGQGLELYWREKNICPTEVDYLRMAYLKVSVGYLLVAKVMNIFSTGQQLNVEKLLTTFGIYFQIYDDHRNIRDKMYFESKGFCDDLTEGKFSFPLVHAINNFPEKGTVIKNILKQRTTNVEEKNRIIAILEECGSFEYTEQKMKELKEIIFKEIDKIDGHPLMKQFLENAILAYL